MDADAIITAIREVATGQGGTVRKVAQSTIQEGVYEGLNDSRTALRARVRTAIDVRAPRMQRTGAVGPQTANREVISIEVDVMLTHSTEHELREDERHGARAAAAEDATAIRRALGWPGNVTVTIAGTATGIVSGCLLERSPWAITREDWGKRILQSELHLRGWVLDTQPIA